MSSQTPLNPPVAADRNAPSPYNYTDYTRFKFDLANGDDIIMYMPPQVNFRGIVIGLESGTDVTFSVSLDDPDVINGAGTPEWLPITNTARMHVLSGPVTAIKFTNAGLAPRMVQVLC